MLKLMFMPVRLIGGIVAGVLATKVFERIWSVIDKEGAPDPEHREIPLPKLLAALVLEGAIFRAVRGLVDHGSRVAFSRVTGRWPGEERPEPGGS
jgi:Protein of unknown function (DUF4235)